jgi:hypothetical protein
MKKKALRVEKNAVILSEAKDLSSQPNRDRPRVAVM